MPLSIAHSRDTFGQRDAEPPPGLFGQLLGAHRAVGVGDAPELLGVAEVLVRDEVEALALGDDVLADDGEAVGRGDEAAAQVDDLGAVLAGEPAGLRQVVAAVWAEHRFTSSTDSRDAE